MLRVVFFGISSILGKVFQVNFWGKKSSKIIYCDFIVHKSQLTFESEHVESFIVCDFIYFGKGNFELTFWKKSSKRIYFDFNCT